MQGLIPLAILLFWLLPKNRKGKYHRVTMWWAALNGLAPIAFWFMGYEVDGIGTLLTMALSIWIFWYAYKLQQKWKAVK